VSFFSFQTYEIVVKDFYPTKKDNFSVFKAFWGIFLDKLTLPAYPPHRMLLLRRAPSDPVENRRSAPSFISRFSGPLFKRGFMTLPYFHVDAFADRPFGGNRAGVCLLGSALDQALMQRMADEINLAETSFVQRQGSEFSLKWFTPTVELPLCGHGTLATAHILWQQGWWPREKEIIFNTISGPLGVRCLPTAPGPPHWLFWQQSRRITAGIEGPFSRSAPGDGDQ
jgi:hypothetical protein